MVYEKGVKAPTVNIHPPWQKSEQKPGSTTDTIWMGEIKEGLCPVCHAGCDHLCFKTCGEDSSLNSLPKPIPT